MLTQEELDNISREIVSTVEGSFGIGLGYEDVVDVIRLLLIEEFGEPTISYDS